MKKLEPLVFHSGSYLTRKYRIGERLGGGWEGEVYRVTEVDTNIDRAAKIYFPHRNPKGKAAIRYAQKLNRLKHCSILIQYHHQDYVYRRGNRVDFLISDLVEGELLSRFVSKRPGGRLQPFEALHALYAIVRGIEPIHQAAEYHGDIHSDNIMISRSGVGFNVKLIDFFDMGRPTRDKIKMDVLDIIDVFYEILGGRKRYRAQPPVVKWICRGLRHSLILERFRSAGDIRVALENLPWDTLGSP